MCSDRWEISSSTCKLSKADVAGTKPNRTSPGRCQTVTSVVGLLSVAVIFSDWCSRFACMFTVIKCSPCYVCMYICIYIYVLHNEIHTHVYIYI